MMFAIYSYITRLGWLIMDLLPPFFRRPLFKLLLGRLGKRGNIDYTVYIRYMKQVEIGSDVWINRGCKFFASHAFKDVKIRIGNHVAVGPDCCFFAAGHDMTKMSIPDTAESITVGDHVWIGGRSVILQGVTLGEGAIVAAGSVVTKDVEPYTVVGGIPARKIKDRNVTDRNI